jgi:hypothetical protein
MKWSLYESIAPHSVAVSNIAGLPEMQVELSEQMARILMELKIMNTHLSILTDNTIGEEDVN